MNWPLFTYISKKYLNINQIGIMLIDVCPMYGTPGLKAP